MGPTGMPKAFMALSSASKSTPSCTNAVTSTMNGDRQRFTKKPGTSLTKIGVLPCLDPTSMADAATSGAVPAWVMISSSGIIGTGEK